MTDLGHWRHIWRLEGNLRPGAGLRFGGQIWASKGWFDAWRANWRLGGQIWGLEVRLVAGGGWFEAWKADLRPGWLTWGLGGQIWGLDGQQGGMEGQTEEQTTGSSPCVLQDPKRLPCESIDHWPLLVYCPKETIILPMKEWMNEWMNEQTNQ